MSSQKTFLKTDFLDFFLIQYVVGQFLEIGVLEKLAKQVRLNNFWTVRDKKF